MIWFLSYF